MTISFEPRRGYKRRVNVLLDGDYAFTANKRTLSQNDIKEGEQAKSLAALIEIIYEQELASALERSYYFLETRMRSGKELRQNLAKAGFSQEITDAAMEELERLGFLDDRAFSESWAQMKLQNKSVRMVAYELKQKGISSEIIDEIKESAPRDDEEEKCLAVLTKYMRSREFTRENLNKAAQACMRKGYDWEMVKSSLAKMKEGVDADGEGEGIDDEY